MRGSRWDQVRCEQKYIYLSTNLYFTYKTHKFAHKTAQLTLGRPTTGHIWFKYFVIPHSWGFTLVGSLSNHSVPCNISVTPTNLLSHVINRSQSVKLILCILMEDFGQKNLGLLSLLQQCHHGLVPPQLVTWATQ